MEESRGGKIRFWLYWLIGFTGGSIALAIPCAAGDMPTAFCMALGFIYGEWWDYWIKRGQS